LIKLVQFFDLFHSGPPRYDDAIEVLDSLGIIASSTDPDDLEAKMTKFERLDENIKRNISEVALSCMEMYFFKYKQVKTELTTGGDRRHPVTGSGTPGPGNTGTVSGSGSGNTSIGNISMGSSLFGTRTPKDAARQKILEVYRDKARGLVNFMGMNSAHVGADVNAKLVRLEALMS